MIFLLLQYTNIFFLFNRHCNACGLLPAQLSLSILSRKVFYRVPLPAARQTPQLGGPVIRTFQLPSPGVPHVWDDASETQQRKVKLWARNCREFCRKWRLPRYFWVLLHDVNLIYKYVEENNILWINNNQCIKLVIDIKSIHDARSEKHHALCTFTIISRWIDLRMRNISDKICTQNQNSYLVSYIFFFPKFISFVV